MQFGLLLSDRSTALLNVLTIASLRALTNFMSTRKPVPPTRPKSGPRCNMCAAYALGATEFVALDDSYLHADGREASSERWSGLTRTDDDCVILWHNSSEAFWRLCINIDFYPPSPPDKTRINGGGGAMPLTLFLLALFDRQNPC